MFHWNRGNSNVLTTTVVDMIKEWTRVVICDMGMHVRLTCDNTTPPARFGLYLDGVLLFQRQLKLYEEMGYFILQNIA